MHEHNPAPAPDDVVEQQQADEAEIDESAERQLDTTPPINEATRLTVDAWVCEQLAAFAPLGPADLVVLAAILGYDADVPREAA